jgi:hypothetical protein
LVDDVLVRAPAGSVLRSTPNGLVLFRKGDTPPDVPRRNDPPRGRVTVVGPIDTKTLIEFLWSMGRSGEWAIVDIRRDAKMTATEALSIAALNPMTGTVVLPRDGLVTPVPTQVIHHVGAVDADGNLTFPQLGQLAVLAQPLREGRRPYQLRIDRKGRSKFWRPFQHDYVVDPRNPAALWV